jgi:hypothetical protein
LLKFSELKVEPVPLPPAAAQPERQPWVLEAHVTNSRAAVRAASDTLEKAAQKLEELLGAADPSPSQMELFAGELAAAGLAVASLDAEAESVRLRADAMRAGWAAEPMEEQARTRAVAAERAAAEARQRHLVAVAELRLLRAAADKRDAAEKELKNAREALAKAARLATTTPSKTDSYTVLYGAKWTPTRFRSSAKDDPEVPFPTESTGRRRALASLAPSSSGPRRTSRGVPQSDRRPHHRQP